MEQLVFTVVLRKADGTMVRETTVAASLVAAISKVQAAVGGTTTVVSAQEACVITLE